MQKCTFCRPNLNSKTSKSHTLVEAKRKMDSQCDDKKNKGTEKWLETVPDETSQHVVVQLSSGHNAKAFQEKLAEKGE